MLGEIELLLELDGVGHLGVLCVVSAQLYSSPPAATRLTLKGAAETHVEIVVCIGASGQFRPSLASLTNHDQGGGAVHVSYDTLL